MARRAPTRANDFVAPGGMSEAGPVSRAAALPPEPCRPTCDPWIPWGRSGPVIVPPASIQRARAPSR